MIKIEDARQSSHIYVLQINMHMKTTASFKLKPVVVFVCMFSTINLLTAYFILLSNYYYFPTKIHIMYYINSNLYTIILIVGSNQIKSVCFKSMCSPLSSVIVWHMCANKIFKQWLLIFDLQYKRANIYSCTQYLIGSNEFPSHSRKVHFRKDWKMLGHFF